MKGLMSLVYALAVDKLVTERERRNKILKVKSEIRQINTIIAKSGADPKYKNKISRELVEFSNEAMHYDIKELDNVLETLNTLKLGAKVLKYFSSNNKIARGLEELVSRVEFSEFVDSSDFEYELINSLDNALKESDYIVKSFKNKTLLELRNKVKFQKFVYKVAKNFSTTTPRYFLDNKLRDYTFKKKKTEGNSVTLYFSHGKTIEVKYTKHLDLNEINNDVAIYVIPQLNKEEIELAESYFNTDNLIFVYSIADNKLYYNKKDARALYFADYLGDKVPVSSEKILSKIAKKRGIYAAAELGIDDSSLPFDLEGDIWR